MSKKEDNTSWGKVASWYDDLLEGDSDTYQTKVILPNLVRLLEIKKGEIVLDLACGQGFFSRAISALGAEVTGVDVGEELIAKALEKSVDGHHPLYYVAPSHNLSKTADHSIDKIIIVLAIQNIEKMKETFEECRRVLKDTGKLFIVLNHPAFRIPKKSSWDYDEKNNIQYRRVDSYISESKTEMLMNPSKENGPKTISFHRPLQTYFKTLSKSGFAVSRLEEWNSHKKSEEGKRQLAEDTARKEIPLFLCLEAIIC
ncbi:MAG: class I SAM-dependent methyltransferase [Candidatus Paceibacterota bacterium]|jgi:ubiquinone/menaquinone biosynthesis C-methylase UbiE